MKRLGHNMESKICILPRLEGIGGPAAFYSRIKKSLLDHGFDVSANPLDLECRSILVIGGTHQVLDLWQARKRNLRIVQRLNGMNWVHRKRFTGIGHFLRSEKNNLILAVIRRYLAHRIVYQSCFSQQWWLSNYHSISKDERVIYNGVDLAAYSPGNGQIIPNDRIRILVVEGNIGWGHEYGLRNSFSLGKEVHQYTGRPVELVIAGQVPPEARSRWGGDENLQVRYLGVIPREEVLPLYQSAHFIFPVELNASCPNSVIEAMACACPVLGFATGSISELIGDEAGICVPYGRNHWMLEMPDIPALGRAACEILEKRNSYSIAARQRAQRLFSVETMAAGYLAALLD
jgi:glycosyltransferase involved in cell wall biosynthesis